MVCSRYINLLLTLHFALLWLVLVVSLSFYHNMLTFFAKKFVLGLHSFLGDTVDILNSIKDFKYEQNDVMVTFDVQSLYTCIPHEVGLDALTHYFNRRPDGILPPNKFLLILSEMILTRNVFK